MLDDMKAANRSPRFHQAKELYFNGECRSLAEVARKLNLSERYLQRVAKVDRWREDNVRLFEEAIRAGYFKRLERWR